MGQSAEHAGKSTDFLNHFLNTVRVRLKRYRLIAVIRIFRALFHFGPWRVLAWSLIRLLRPVSCRTPVGEHSSLLGDLDTAALAREVHQNSIAVAGVLPADFVSRLRKITDNLPVNQYQLMHHLDEDVSRLASDPGLQQVLRSYFHCEPVLLESTLAITGPAKIHGLGKQNHFHFDFAGWQSLNVLIYLSEVSAESSYHIVAKGSHRQIGIRDIIRGTIGEQEADRRFGSSIQNILGPAGTLFFENTEAFHRRNPGSGRRVMFNLLYASHRSWLSKGRTSQAHIDKRMRIYRQCQS